MTPLVINALKNKCTQCSNFKKPGVSDVTVLYIKCSTWKTNKNLKIERNRGQSSRSDDPGYLGHLDWITWVYEANKSI